MISKLYREIARERLAIFSWIACFDGNGEVFGLLGDIEGLGALAVYVRDLVCHPVRNW